MSDEPNAEQVGAVDPTVAIERPEGTGPVVLACEHASNAMPAEYRWLGLDPQARVAHIAWDPGALGVARILSERLDAPLVHQRASRLLYDCNRPPQAESAMPAVSEVYSIPGNAGLDEAERARRVTRFYEPWRRTLAGVLGERRARLAPTALVTIHTFTPVYRGVPRTVEIGVLHDADTRLADALLAACAAAGGYDTRRNEPYGPQDGVTHTLVEHALPLGLPNVMIEVRNDLVGDAAGEAAIGAWLGDRLEEALAALGMGAR
jgi:predicted N-formylglutamate amidohydrolase